MDRHGEMSRLRVSAGLRISSSPQVSSYIIERKIRSIIHQFGESIAKNQAKTVDRLINKLDKLGKPELEYLHYLGTEESVHDMVMVLKMTFNNITKLSSKWIEQKNKNLSEE